MNFSSILDISSFFIGMIINLILVSLMCYYFKRKYEILEIAQTEQAKILYNLLRRDSTQKTETFIQTLNEERVDYTKDPLLKPRVIESDSESESDSSESESEYEIEVLPPSPRNSPSGSPSVTPPVSPPDLSQPLEMLELDEVKIEELTEQPTESVVLEVETQQVELKSETKEIVLDITLESPESNYNKMSIKQLKDILTSKGVKPKHNMKKDELVDLVKDIEHEVSI
jgi:hypothetical protein